MPSSKQCRPVPVTMLVLFLAAVGCSPTASPGLSQVVDAALDGYRARIEGVRDYTTIVETSDVRDTVRFEREMLNGLPVFVPVTGPGSELPRRATQDPYALLTALSPENAVLAGRETVDGEPCHVIGITSFDDPALGRFFGPLLSSGIATPEEMKLLLDVDEHLPRRMSFRGVMSLGAESLPMTYTVHFRDYREVEGLVHPFLTEATVAVERSDERRAAPPLATALDATVRVVELRVNEGPPPGS